MISLHEDAAEIPAQLLFLTGADGDFVRRCLRYESRIQSERSGSLENDLLEGHLVNMNSRWAASELLFQAVVSQQKPGNKQ